jgi:hypothetical protein
MARLADLVGGTVLYKAPRRTDAASVRKGSRGGGATTIIVLLLGAVLAVPAQAAADRMPISAGITSFTPACAGIALTAQGSDPYGISTATVTLQALGADGSATTVEETTFTYASPTPKQIGVAWSSSQALTPGISYSVMFRIRERTGDSPVAVGGIFTCT